tara:strand:- start:1616 stop:5794 length:4179 start_codon:yes stop_codon:yes gene_type:complete
MPKSSLKIDRFEGGINKDADPRNIEDNQCQDLSNIDINKLGQITNSGSAVNYIEEVDKIEIREAGWGLFFFRSDYDIIDDDGLLRGGTYLHGSDEFGRNINSNLGSEESVSILAKLFDPVDTDTGTKAGIALRENNTEMWTSLTNVLPLYEDEDYVKAPINSNFQTKNGALRIWDSNFKQFAMTNKWLGVIKETKFIGKDNVNYDTTKTPNWNRESAWLYTHAECKPPTSIQSELFKRIEDTNWQNNTLSSPSSGSHNNSTTTVSVDTGATFQDGDILLINSELLFVVSITSDNLTVVRGAYGSEKTSHTDNDLVYLVWRNSTSNEVYSPFNYGYYPSLNNKNLSHKDYNAQVIALDFTDSDSASEMYEDATPMLVASDFDDATHNTTHDSDTTYGWGLATDGMNNWSQEFDGIQFMYDFVEQTDLDEIAWNKGYKYRFYATLLYDGNPDINGQESTLTDITPINSNILNKQGKLRCNLSVKWTGKNKDNTQRRTDSHLINKEHTTAETERNKELYINPRVVGCRIYYSSSEDNNSEKFLLLHANFNEDGGIKREGGRYMPWCPVNYGNGANIKKSHYRISSKSDDTSVNINNSHRIDLSAIGNSGNSWMFDAPPAGQTYFNLNGHSGELTNVLYKCSTEVNGIRHVGNVCYPVNWDETKSEVQDASFEDLTRGTKYGDRMIMQIPGQYDILTPENNVDVVINDGDEITHLESLGSYLLQFKRDVLYIINVTATEGSVSHQVAGTYKFKGVDKPYQVVKTDKEVFWVNYFGAYIFTGEDVIDVSENKLKADAFRNFKEFPPILGYDQITRDIYIKTKSNIYKYNLDTQSWTFHRDYFPVDGLVSNFTNNEEGNLVFSVYNSNIGGINVNGLYFQKNDTDNGGGHYIGTSSANPVDVNNVAFSFEEKFKVGDILNIKNTGLTSSYVTSNGLNFHKFSFFTGSINTSITLFTNPVTGETAPHLDVGDIIKLNDNVRYFRFEDTVYRIEGLSGYWQIENVRPQATFVPEEDEVIERTTPDTDEGEEDDVSILEGVNYPYSFQMIKRTDVGVGEHVNNLKIYDNATGIDVSSSIISQIRSTNSTTQEENIIINLTDESLSLQSLNWNTLFEKDRLENVSRGNLLNKSNYFDGNYKIEKIESSQLVKVSKYFGDGNFNMFEGGNNPNFSRFYYDLRSNRPMARTGKVTGFSDQYYTYIPISNMQMMSRTPQPGAFFLITKDFDFGEPSRSKRIYKVYVTYSTSVNIPNLRIFLLVTTKDGVNVMFPNNDKSKNYGILHNPDIDGITIDPNLNPGEIESFHISSLKKIDYGNAATNQIYGSSTAEIYFNDSKNLLKNCLSVSVGMCPSSFNLQSIDINNFEIIDDPSSDLNTSSTDILNAGPIIIHDINIIYRGKNVK